MSRIGKAPISVPDGVTVKVSASAVTVSSKQGELSQEIPEGIQVEVQDAPGRSPRRNRRGHAR